MEDINIYVNYLLNKLHKLKEKLTNTIETNTINGILENRQRTTSIVQKKNENKFTLTNLNS